MCGRYSLFAPPAEIEARFDVTLPAGFQPRYNAAPSQSLPVVDESASVEMMEWGFVPSWADDAGDFQFINARAETLSEKPTFRGAFEQTSDGTFACGRCLVLADGFYEWTEENGQKQPYRVTLAQEEPFAMAGLWARWQPSQTQTGLGDFAGGEQTEPDVRETFAIVTTEPNDLIADLHHRMAVILPEGREQEWLRTAPEDATQLLAPYPAEEMRAYPVSTAVNDPSNDTPDVLEPVDPS
jgi:putative SOS response-associated peptidase YedK